MRAQYIASAIFCEFLAPTRKFRMEKRRPVNLSKLLTTTRNFLHALKRFSFSYDFRGKRTNSMEITLWPHNKFMNAQLRLLNSVNSQRRPDMFFKPTIATGLAIIVQKVSAKNSRAHSSSNQSLKTCSLLT